MASNRARRQIIFQNENLDFHHKALGSVADGRTTSVKKASKRVEPGYRKALNDISNSSLHHGASSRKKTPQKEEFNEEEFNIWEGFLHDHSKCVDAQRKALEYNFSELVLTGHDSVTSISLPKSEQEKVGLDCPPRGLEPIKEVPMSDFCLDSPTLWDSPCSPTLPSWQLSPTLWHSPRSPTLWDSPCSPTPWPTLELVKFVLKPGIED